MADGVTHTEPPQTTAEDQHNKGGHRAQVSPADWVRQNLFNNAMNSAITIVMALLIGLVTWLLVSWVINEEWKIIRATLRLFMVGTFPRDELWRLWASGYVIIATIGLVSGASARTAYESNLEIGLPAAKESLLSLLRRFWAIAAVLIFFTSFARTWSPVIGMAFVFVLVVVAREVGWALPAGFRQRMTFVAIALLLVAMMIMAGTSKLGGQASALLAFVWTWVEIERRELAPASVQAIGRHVVGAIVGLVPFVLITTARSDGFAWGFWNNPSTWSFLSFLLGIAAIAATSAMVARFIPADRISIGLSRTLTRVAAGLVMAFFVFMFVVLLRSDGFAWDFWDRPSEYGGMSGFGWEEWGGLHVTLFVSIVGIGLGMPFGILLALGRQSDLPVVKGASIMFIEFVRGVPLISLLLFSTLMLPLFLPVDLERPADLTLAMVVIMGFSAAYIAEIVRGGLQAVPQGQTEAAQASGLSPGAVQRLVVLPQALRAVIPAMVGQFIALFKDTSLLAIIGIAEFFQIGSIANVQTEFLGKEKAAVTYAFIAIGYWAFAYTMSKESRRLETKLGVGTR